MDAPPHFLFVAAYRSATEKLRAGQRAPLTYAKVSSHAPR
jgi:hypothetical protein